MTMLGKKHSKETKMKISLAKKNISSWNKGLKCPEISNKAKENEHNNYFRKGCEPWNKNKNISEEHKLKISRANKGKVSAMKGKTHTKEAREKISKTHRGRKWSKEIIKKRTEAIWGRDHREKQLKAILKGLIKRPTSLEIQMIEIIKKHNFPYKYVGNGSFLVGYKNPDFVNINGEKKLIEVGNIFHHQGDYVKNRKNHFAKYGWETLFFITNKLEEKEVVSILKEENKK